MMLGRSPACAGVVIGSGPTSKMEKKASNKKGFLFMLMITSVREGGSPMEQGSEGPQRN